MGLQTEKTAGLITILTEKLYFDRSVLAQVSGTEHDASEVVSIALALPLGWSSRSFAAPEGSRAKILSNALPQRNAQQGLLAHS